MIRYLIGRQVWEMAKLMPCWVFIYNNISTFICAYLEKYAHCGNYGNSLPHFFGKNFVKVTFLLKKEITKELIWRNSFLSDRHTAACSSRSVEKWKF